MLKPLQYRENWSWKFEDQTFILNSLRYLAKDYYFDWFLNWSNWKHMINSDEILLLKIIMLFWVFLNQLHCHFCTISFVFIFSHERIRRTLLQSQTHSFWWCRRGTYSLFSLFSLFLLSLLLSHSLSLSLSLPVSMSLSYLCNKATTLKQPWSPTQLALWGRGLISTVDAL